MSEATRHRGLSIRTRLTLWYALAVALSLAVFATAVYLAMWGSLDAELDRNLVEGDSFFAARLEHQFGDEELGYAIESVVRKSPFRSLSLEIYGPDGGRLAASPDLGPDALAGPTELKAEGLAIRANMSPVFGSAGADSVSSRVVHPLTGESYTIVTYARREPVADSLAALLRLMAGLAPVLLLLSAAVGHLLAARSLAPVVAMAAQARAMGAEHLSDRLAVPNPSDELGELARTFNGLLDRVESAFVRMREFVADASHELRTPVAVIRGEADVALSPPTSADESLESLAVIRDEATRLSRLVDDMFVLARADAQQIDIRAEEPVDVRDLVERAARAAEPLGTLRGVTVATGAIPDPSPEVLGDRARLEQLLLNLLDNATKYAGKGSAVTIAARFDGESVAIDVADTGVGIPETHRAAVFERFYCIDRARTRKTGGSGLGLPIARLIAEAHGGSLTFAPNVPSGSVFTVRLPAEAAATPTEETSTNVSIALITVSSTTR